MLIFIILFIILSIVVLYYFTIKRKYTINEVVICNNTLLCFILEVLNYIFSKHYIFIFNPFTNRIHIPQEDYYFGVEEDSVLLCHNIVHIYQSQCLGKCKFLILYMKELIKKGHYNNIFEKQARDYELQGKPDFNTICSDLKQRLKD